MSDRKQRRSATAVALGIALGLFGISMSLCGQLESVATSPPRFNWVSHGRVEGHLALNQSPAAAFSPDSSTLAVMVEDKILLMNLAAADIRKVLRPRVEGITEFQFRSANYVAPNRLFIQGSGLFRVAKKGSGGATPTLALQWDIDQDILFGKVNTVGAGGGYGTPRYFPQIGYLVFYKESNFDMWHPVTERGGRVSIPSLTRQPNLFEFSPDGHWLLLAQIEANSTADPVVVDLRQHQFVEALRGHQGTVLSMAFSRDSKRVLTFLRGWQGPNLVGPRVETATDAGRTSRTRTLGGVLRRWELGGIRQRRHDGAYLVVRRRKLGADSGRKSRARPHRGLLPQW